MPLARRATQANISAIYVGGLIQLLFGITGRRYSTRGGRGLIKKVHKNNNSSHARGMDGGNETAVVVDSRLATDTLSGSLINEHWFPPLASETPKAERVQDLRKGGVLEVRYFREESAERRRRARVWACCGQCVEVEVHLASTLST